MYKDYRMLQAIAAYRNRSILNISCRAKNDLFRLPYTSVHNPR